MELFSGVIKGIGAFFFGILAFFGGHSVPAPGSAQTGSDASVTESPSSGSPSQGIAVGEPNPSAPDAINSARVYSDSELLAMADNRYTEGNVPLGDYKYVTTGAKKGYVYLCNARKDNPGSMVNGPWMGTNTWNFLQKVIVDGTVSWPGAQFSNTVSGTSRTLSGNDLPVNHTTGVFPVAPSDDAHQYDANPNTISSQQLSQKVPASPKYSQTPYCMGGEVGIMLSGVALFNAFDAGLRDAPAHELQDSCSGHPQGSGEYHYHNLSACFKDTSVKTVLGFAYDGFPITGPQVASKKYLTTEDLDECHGLASEIVLDGKKTVTYHYVMTQDFPYSVSCFRGKPATTGPSAGGGVPGALDPVRPTQTGGTPPQEALDACSNKASGDSCYFGTPNGTISGTCLTPPGASALACVPR